MIREGKKELGVKGVVLRSFHQEQSQQIRLLSRVRCRANWEVVIDCIS